jgi:hypothetical protein
VFNIEQVHAEKNLSRRSPVASTSPHRTEKHSQCKATSRDLASWANPNAGSPFQLADQLRLCGESGQLPCEPDVPVEEDLDLWLWRPCVALGCGLAGSGEGAA